MAKFTEGNPGRPKGAVNKSTKLAKEMVVEFVEAALPVALDKLKEIENPKEYLDALSKFIAYVVPKQSEVDVKTNVINLKVPGEQNDNS